MAFFREWDLVVTDDGYYAIVTDAPNRMVYLANGCQQQLSLDNWTKLKSLPLNVKETGVAEANFVGLDRTSLVPVAVRRLAERFEIHRDSRPASFQSR